MASCKHNGPGCRASQGTRHQCWDEPGANALVDPNDKHGSAARHDRWGSRRRSTDGVHQKPALNCDHNDSSDTDACDDSGCEAGGRRTGAA